LKLLVTGSGGFTGRQFCSKATKTGFEVVKLKADILDREGLKSEILDVKPDLIVHLAGISNVANPDKISFYNVNVIGTTNLLDAVLGLPVAPSKVLIASSANVYGNCNVPSIDENLVTNPTNHYAASKLAMEKMALTYNKKIPIVITRPFNYTGLGQSLDFVIPKLVSHFIDKSPEISMGNIDVEREFNDVRTVCDSYLMLLKYGKDGEIYNICSGNSYSLSYVISLLSELTAHNARISVDQRLVRDNELTVLRGDPSKLNRLIIQSSTKLTTITLKDTLKLMLQGSHR
jgi:nucleoside-diphosphate-sugar epimerase